MDKKSVPIFNDLREQIFTLDSEKNGIPPVGNNNVFGVVMDIGFPEGWATIVALSDGNASMYLSGGSGVIGGLNHNDIRETAISMATVADQFVPDCLPTTETPLPISGDVTFYILTTRGIRTMTAREEDLGEQRHALSPLFNKGQEVITLLMLVSERK